ncbi:hypothetical protein EMPG_10751, partial [Blastomyces silverae]
SELTIKIENTSTFIRNISSVKNILIKDFSETEDFLINSKIISLLILRNLIYIKTSLK